MTEQALAASRRVPLAQLRQYLEAGNFPMMILEGIAHRARPHCDGQRTFPLEKIEEITLNPELARNFIAWLDAQVAA